MKDEQLDRILAEARATPADVDVDDDDGVDVSRVAYGLETRVMARLKERERVEASLYQWTSRFVWRAVAGLAAVTLLLGAAGWYGGGTAALLKGDTVLIEAFKEPISAGGLGAGL